MGGVLAEIGGSGRGSALSIGGELQDIHPIEKNCRRMGREWIFKYIYFIDFFTEKRS